MKIRLFDFDKDYQMIKDWHNGWGMEPIPTELLPLYGLIASNHSTDVAAAWVYITDGKIAMIEGAILNPLSTRKQRYGIHEFLTNHMLELSKSLGCLKAMIICKDKYLTSVCEKLGCGVLPYDFKVLTKEL